MDVDKLSDAELRTKLLEFGFPLMPITGTTRKIMAKKLKLLMENKTKIGAENASTGRRSLGRYSSEEESDSDIIKPTKKKENRRITMAAPLLPPKETNSGALRSRRSNSRLNDSDGEQEVQKAPQKEIKVTSVTTTRSSRIVQRAQDEFDTGSDSETEILANYTSKKQSPLPKPLSTSYTSSLKYSPPKLDTSSPLSGSMASEYASDRLNSMRSRLSLNNSVYDRAATTSTHNTYSADDLDGEETPYLSNFTKRLSQLSAAPKNDYKSDIIKEYDTNGAGSYSSNVRSQLSSFRAGKGRDTTYDYRQNQTGILRNNFVSFAVLAGAALFFIFLAIMYLGLRSDTSVVPADYKVPICVPQDHAHIRGVTCLDQSDVQHAINYVNFLRMELQQRAIDSKCSDTEPKSPKMTEDDIIRYSEQKFNKVTSETIRKDLTNAEILLLNNPQWGVRVEQDGNAVLNMNELVTSRDVSEVSFLIPDPDLPWSCKLANTALFLGKTLILLLGIFGIVYSTNYGFKYYKFYVEKEREQVGFMVERILDILQTNAAEEKDGFLVINHVRDMILPVADRKKKSKTWSKAVTFISENESRVRTEVQEVRGEPYEVWRWIGHASTSSPQGPNRTANKSWQGQAFETQLGSVNSPLCSPTPCLKVRGMVDDGDHRNTHTIREAVLAKCAHHCHLLHCAVDTASKCVYLKCADQADAAIAYRNLHGWWYAGHLVTVKYLRLERYMQRFPDSPPTGPPYLKAISPSNDWIS